MKSVRKEVEGRMITFFECPECNSARTYSRLKTQDRVCYNCGAITSNAAGKNGVVSDGLKVSPEVKIDDLSVRLGKFREEIEDRLNDIDSQLGVIWDRLPEKEEGEEQGEGGEEEQGEDKEKKPQEKCKECSEVFDITNAVMNTSSWDSVLWVICPNCNDRVRKATEEECEQYQ